MMQTLVPILLEAALRAIIAAFAVWSGLRLFRVRNVLAEKAAWSLVLVAVLAMPLIVQWQVLPAAATLRVPALLPANLVDFRMSAAPSPTPVQAKQLPEAFAAPQPQLVSPPANLSQAENPSLTGSNSVADLSVSDEPLSEPGTYPSSAAEPPTNSPQPNRQIFWLAELGASLYLMVCAILLIRLIAGLGAAIRLWWKAEPVSGIPGFSVSGGVSLRASRRIASPVNVASGIILPADYANWDADKLRIVLAHERSHIRQGDFYLQLLAGLYAALFWFSPLGWWLKDKLSELAEAISDRAGLQEAPSRTAYAQLLLEFAALPRPTLSGVAMARTQHLSSRIERLLNEASFRQAFANGRRRAFVALLLVPAALMVTSLVRVQAAQAALPTAQDQTGTQSPHTGVSSPPDQSITDQAPAPAPQQAPNAAPSPAPSAKPHAAPAPPAPPSSPETITIPPIPPLHIQVPPIPPIHVQIPPMPPMPDVNAMLSRIYGVYPYLYADGGDTYAIVGEPGTHAGFSFSAGRDSDRAREIEKARKMTHGKFLWFRHDGKSYILDDPAIMAQIEAMNKPMEDLGKQMRELGAQQREIGKKQRALAKEQRDVQVPIPDLSKEMADLNAAMADLKAKQGTTISQEQLAEIMRKVAEV
ncbi:MAG: hypothetical protein KGL37_09350, partial [Acidobacteriota bacterium]|nr:hypothetical protein [Acidobacteriota bacterium]